ncbi:MAG: RNA-binding protein [Niastella sp. SCN 39-18]|nr:RNA-binding protein [Sphingobacteriales bacterium]ODT54476.1 MAG: RNA-binding protein [Niastella sp. SCN 39-18]OJW10824.1 MAG: RNA-binding protein [Sphingobacteriales bacterium 39-19]
MNIYVGNLSWSMTDSDLNDLFIQFGTVSSAKILKDKMSGRSKGFGFVEMENDEEAKAAIANLNETEIQGRKIVVNESQPRPEGEFKKRSGSFGSGGNRGGGGGSRGGYGGGGSRGGGYGGGNRGGYSGNRESRDY